MKRLILLCALLLAACQIAPGDAPWTELSLRDPVGRATASKLARLHDDPRQCRALLTEAQIGFADLEESAPSTQPECSLAMALRIERTSIPYGQSLTLSCPLSAALFLWERDVLGPAALMAFGPDVTVTRIEQIGTYACRRIYGQSEGRISQHASASANAIDIAGFRLSDGRRISVEAHYGQSSPEGQFLAGVREGACAVFSGVLGPEYNAAHRDHFHLDMGPYRICS